MSRAAELLETCFREEYGRIVSVLMRVLGSLEEAEDVIQSAAARALEDWPKRGFPSRPGAWLTTVSRRIALDRIRRRAVEGRARERLTRDRGTGPRTTVASGRAPENDPYDLLDAWPDERLRLMFVCCRPDLPVESRLALTLKEVSGLTTPRVAAAFLVSEATIAQRLVRAKRRLRERRVALEVPAGTEILARLGDVLGVIYLVFNAGYLQPHGTALLNAELCDEAIHLARTVVELMRAAKLPESAEALGLSALLILTHSRRDARCDPWGMPVLLEDQDRGLWHADEAAEGLALLDRAAALRSPGPYQLKAAVAALHHTAGDAADTDWRGIESLYKRLYAYEANPVVRLNAIVAHGMWAGAERGLAELEELATNTKALDSYTYFHLARARFLRELGRPKEAGRSLFSAAELTTNDAERRFIEAQLAALGS